MQKIIVLTTIPLVLCNWETEWLVPIQDIYSKETTTKSPDDVVYRMLDDKLSPIYEDGDPEVGLKNKDMKYGIFNDEPKTVILIEKLKDTLLNARALAETLKTQIVEIASRENVLKEAIANGRSGTTVLTVLSTSRIPRTYIIRDGFWTLCNGMVQDPANELRSTNSFNELFAAPRCIGQEVSSRQDPCVFNSLIKYETIPRRRGPVYSEDDYLCLKTSFNQTLEQYLSVPKYVVNETCRYGIVKRLAENSLDCGLRVMSEYTYYPHKGFAASNLPLEYCSEGTCKLTVAWHISNSTVENFEYLKSDKAFKNFFLNSVAHGSTVI